MFGKREIEARKGRFLSLNRKARYFDPEDWSRWLLFVEDFYKQSYRKNVKQISPVLVSKNPDNRPYVELFLFGKRITALLDSGANRSIIDSKGLKVISDLGLEVCPSSTKFVTTADGSKQPVSGVVTFPLCVDGFCELITALVVPDLLHTFILGSDFCRKFNLLIDFKENTWCVRVKDGTELCVCDVTSARSDYDDRNGDNYTSEQQIQIHGVVKEFQNLNKDGKLGRTSRLIHHIDTGDARPIKQRQYLMSPYMLDHLNEELDRMIELEVVEPSMSEWSSPVLLVKKSNGEFRFCFDGSKLNSVTKRDSYPLPHVDRILNMLKGAKFISSVDLRSAFWQIPLDETSKEKTAFAIPGRGLFHFTVLPFGLSNAAQTQQRLMDAVFGPKLEPNIFVYLDDIIIISSTFEQHIDLLREVAERLREANFTVNINKCEFFRSSLKYLGFIVDRQGLRTDPDKVAAMLSYPQPKTATEIKRFVGLCSWHRRFIPHFSTLMSPINDLLKGKKKGQVTTWNERADEAFNKIKQALVSAPVLSSPDFSKKFCIQCDASDTGLGCILTQEHNGEEKVVAFASRALTKAERCYSVSERGCLAVVFGVEKFCSFVEGVSFTVITDHSALLWLHKLKDPVGKLARWSVKLHQYDFKIVHRRGKLNVVSDALSRGHLPEISAADNLTTTPDIDLDDVDAFYTRMRSNILENPDKYPQWTVDEGYVYKFVPSESPLSSNINYWKLLIPKSQRNRILKSCHDEPTAAHFGFFKTFFRVVLSYYWPGMRKDILRYVRSCTVCASQKSSTEKQPGLMGNERKVSFPFQVISIDLMGKLPTSSKGNSYLLVITDLFSKYTLVHPLRHATATSISTFLVYGVPQFVICDNGKQFVSDSIRSLCKKYEVQKIWYTPYYHPQANPVERYNRTICTAIRSYIGSNHKKWDDEIYKTAYALRTAVNEVTGYSPVYLNFGRVVPCRGSYYGKRLSEAESLDRGDCDNYARELENFDILFKNARKRLSDAHQRSAENYNLRKRDLEFFVGDCVWKRNKILSDASQDFAKKLAPKFVLCKVKRKISKLVYALSNQDGSNAGIWHIKDLKPYLSDDLLDDDR